MPKITSSHKYFKLPSGYERSKLLDVINVNQKELSTSFLEYDTTFDGGVYPLKSGKYMLLLLLSQDNHLWTTIRPICNPAWNKESYYRGNIGQVFDCIIKQEG